MGGVFARRAFAAAFVAALVLASAYGCSLFTKLDVDGYTPLDAATPAASSCLFIADVCVPVTYACTSPKDCDDGSSCCLTLGSTSIRYECCANGRASSSVDAGAAD